MFCRGASNVSISSRISAAIVKCKSEESASARSHLTATIITGSFNFTKAAEENNAENLLVIEGKPKLMAAYQKNFKEHREHSHDY